MCALEVKCALKLLTSRRRLGYLKPEGLRADGFDLSSPSSLGLGQVEFRFSGDLLALSGQSTGHILRPQRHITESGNDVVNDGEEGDDGQTDSLEHVIPLAREWQDCH